jgi:hypothetical protein
MSFTSKYIPVSKHRYFRFFASDGNSAVAWDDTMDEQFDPSCAFILDQIRLHLSTAHVSAVSFYVYMSHHLGSAYNEMILSQAMLGVLDLVYQADNPRVFLAGDTFSIGMAMSAANTFGLTISGWAVTQQQ